MIDPSSHRADLTLTTFSPRPEPRASGSVKKPTGPRIIKLARENIAPGGTIRDPRGLGIHFRTPRKGSFCGRAGFFTDPSASGPLPHPNIKQRARVPHHQAHVHQALLRRDEVHLEDPRDQPRRSAGKGDRQYGRIVRVIMKKLDPDRRGWPSERSNVDLPILAPRIRQINHSK